MFLKRLFAPALVHRWIVVGFFVCVFLIGVFSFRDYGVATDEGTMDALGMATYDYVFKGSEWPTNPAWMYHGTVVEFPLQIIENLFADRSDASRMYLRVFAQHFVTFLLAYLGLVMLYLLARKHFRDWRWALLCCALFLLTPRFFAHSFYNSRDIPTLAFFALSMYTLVCLLEKRTMLRAILHGIATALALALRMPALIIPVITIVFFALDEVRRWIETKKLDLRRSVSLLAIYLCCLCIATVLFWPFLWEHPISHFLEAYQFMRSLDGPQVFMGQAFNSLPWRYVPVWIMATVPVMFTVFFLLGVALLLLSFCKKPARILAERRNDLLFLAWFFLPILSVYIAGAGIYNEWRHIYFIYPAFLLIAVTGLREALKAIHHLQKPARQILASIVMGSLTLQMLLTGTWMIRNHPMEFVYFSLPIPWVAAHLFPPPPDYWGLSYKKAMDFLLAYDSRIMSVYSNDNIAYQNLYNIHPESLTRVMRVPKLEEAMYVVVSKPEFAKGLPLIHGVTVDGMLLNGVYKGPINEVMINPEKNTVEFR